MPLGKPILEIGSFTGGLNTNAGGVVGQAGFESSQAVYMNNAILTKEGSPGAIGKIKGNELKMTLNEACTGLFKAKFKDGTQKVYATGLTKIYEINISTWVATEIKTALASDTGLADFQMMNNYVIVTKHGWTPQTISSSSTVANVTGFPPGGVTGVPTQVEQHKGSLWLSRNATTPDELYYSDFGKIDSWTAKQGGAGFLGLPNGSIIKACKSLFGDVMSIITNRDVWFLAGDTPTPLEGKSLYNLFIAYDGVDFESPHGIINTKMGQIIVDGVNFTIIKPSGDFGNLSQNVISESIAPTLKGTSDYDGISVSYRDKIFGRYLGDQYNQCWFFIPTGGSSSNTDLAIYDLDTSSWFYCKGRGASCMEVLDDKTILTGHSDGKIKEELTGYTVDGAAIEFSWKSGWFDLGEKIALNRLQLVHKQDGNYDITIKIYKNWNNETPVLESVLKPGNRIDTWDDDAGAWDESGWGTSSIAKTWRSALGTAESIMIEVENHNVDEGINLLGIRLFGGYK